MRVASTAVSIVPCPDIITTGMVSWPLAAHSFSSVMPSVSGIQMSSSTRSGRARSRRRARVAGVLGEQYLVALVGEDLRQQLADADFVVDDQDLRHGSGRLRERQQHADRSAAARPVLDRHRAVVLVDDLLHDREAEARCRSAWW